MSATLVSFKSKIAPNRSAPSAAVPDRLALKLAVANMVPASRVARRKEVLTYLFEWIREAAIGMVNDWPELFEVGREHARFQYEEYTIRHPDWEPDNAANLAHDLGFYNRCAQIYAEEMATVEPLAAQARERAAKRIEEELNGKGNGIPAALRENDPQKWAREIDWS